MSSQNDIEKKFSANKIQKSSSIHQNVQLDELITILDAFITFVKLWGAFPVEDWGRASQARHLYKAKSPNI